MTKSVNKRWEALAKEMVDTLQNSPSAEDLKRAAIIFDHIKLFTEHSNDAEKSIP
jgi:hypothetical protein